MRLKFFSDVLNMCNTCTHTVHIHAWQLRYSYIHPRTKFNAISWYIGRAHWILALFANFSKNISFYTVNKRWIISIIIIVLLKTISTRNSITQVMTTYFLTTIWGNITNFIHIRNKTSLLSLNLSWDYDELSFLINCGFLFQKTVLIH